MKENTTLSSLGCIYELGHSPPMWPTWRTPDKVLNRWIGAPWPAVIQLYLCCRRLTPQLSLPSVCTYHCEEVHKHKFPLFKLGRTQVYSAPPAVGFMVRSSSGHMLLWLFVFIHSFYCFYFFFVLFYLKCDSKINKVWYKVSKVVSIAHCKSNS